MAMATATLVTATISATWMMKLQHQLWTSIPKHFQTSSLSAHTVGSAKTLRHVLLAML